MPWVQYSANFEDVLIRRALRSVRNGCYLDVGACYPQWASNTYALYELGWRGIAVDPQPALAEGWRMFRPEDVFLGVAVGDADGDVELHIPTAHTQGATANQQVGASLRTSGLAVEQVRVPRRTLNAILDAHLGARELHLLSLDVEGMEKEALSGLDLTRHRPWLMVIEATMPGEPTPSHAQWEPMVLAAGYECVYFDGVNRFYLRADRMDLRRHFALPPNVWDDFRSFEVELLRRDLARARGT